MVMRSLHDDMLEFKTQLQRGAIQNAYRGLLEYMLSLKNHFLNKYPNLTIPGSLYIGYMDMTYFSILPESLKSRGLKIAIVFNYEAFRFEIWLSGKNKQVLTKFWKILTASGWNKYKVVNPGKGIDFIVEHVMLDQPDFNDLDAMTECLGSETVKFIREIEQILGKIA
jgi:hypothetical protein